MRIVKCPHCDILVGVVDSLTCPNCKRLVGDPPTVSSDAGNQCTNRSDSRIPYEVRRNVFIFIAIAACGLLLPGLYLGGMTVAFLPFRIRNYGFNWIEMVPLSYLGTQVAALLAWLRTPRRFACIPFIAWSILSCASAIVWIGELQWQVSEFDGTCGNILLGTIIVQLAACGTIGGMLLLLFAYWSDGERASDSKVSHVREPVPRKETDGSITDQGSAPNTQEVASDYCSICRREVEVDNDYRCPNCRWPV